jgi:hypothetical protein
MKSAGKFALLFFVVLVVFPSCKTLEMKHYNKSELDKVSSSIGDYNVYLHDKSNTYQVINPSVSPAGIKGGLNPIIDKATIAEIKNPRTRKQLKKHKHDLNIYSKTEIKDNSELLVKKEDITDVSHLANKKGASIGEDIATGFVLGLGVLVWVGVVYSFQGML